MLVHAGWSARRLRHKSAECRRDNAGHSETSVEVTQVQHINSILRLESNANYNDPEKCEADGGSDGMVSPRFGPHGKWKNNSFVRDFVHFNNETLRRSGTLVFIADCEPICALQACMHILQVAAIERIAPETDISVSSHR